MTTQNCPPVLLLIFNRPDTTAKVFARIRDARPAKLFVAADGPRQDRSSEAELCAAARRVTEAVDWPCEVSRRYSDSNQGCGPGPVAGITWVFNHVEQAIILEDDCVAHSSFFRFAGELLDRYKVDPRVMHISGNNFVPWASPRDSSYFFSRYTHNWGWATWRHAWRLYDHDMAEWPRLKEAGWLRTILPDREQAAYWATYFDRVRERERSHVWDAQWMFANWVHGGLSVLPRCNLVSNIGFDSRATHTSDIGSRFANVPRMSMEFPLLHPKQMVICERADRSTFRRVFLQDLGVMRRIVRQMRNRYFWGAQIRRIPLVGKVWARYRYRRRHVSTMDRNEE